MPDSSHEFADLRSAFCARFRCAPDAFVRKVFWKGLPLRVKILTLILGGMSHPRFQHDLEMIRTAADATSMEDLHRVFDEMCSLHEMNRDGLRRWLGLRPSTKRLQALFGPLFNKVRVDPSASAMPSPTPAAIQPSRGNEGRYRAGDGSVHPLRRVLRIHAAVVQGQELDLILEEECTTRRELDELVAEFARKRAEIGWLQRYLRETGKVDFGARRAVRGASMPWVLPMEARDTPRAARFRSGEGESSL